MTESEHFKTVGENLSELGLLKLRNLISLALAALVFLGLYPYVGWVLNTGQAVVAYIVASAAVAFVVSVGVPLKDSLVAALSEFVGMVGAGIVLLFVIGPGTIFPIVIVFLCGLLAISTSVGWALAQPRAIGQWVKANW
jgi:hypothetical protein